MNFMKLYNDKINAILPMSICHGRCNNKNIKLKFEINSNETVL